MALYLDKSLQKQNSYYFDLIEGNVLQPLKLRHSKEQLYRIHEIPRKVRGQNKVPRLSNDRNIADNLLKHKA